MTSVRYFTKPAQLLRCRKRRYNKRTCIAKAYSKPPHLRYTSTRYVYPLSPSFLVSRLIALSFRPWPDTQGWAVLLMSHMHARRRLCPDLVNTRETCTLQYRTVLRIGLAPRLQDQIPGLGVKHFLHTIIGHSHAYLHTELMLLFQYRLTLEGKNKRCYKN